MAEPKSADLTGRAVLVVEDDALVGVGLVAFIEQLGARVTWEATLGRALATVHEAGPFDLAIVDLNLDGQMSTPVLDLLILRRITIILCTGYDRAAIEPRFHHLPLSEKPFTRAKLRRLIVDSL